MTTEQIHESFVDELLEKILEQTLEVIRRTEGLR